MPSSALEFWLDRPESLGNRPRMKNTWQLQEAKNQLSLVVADALTKGPQTITRHGKPTVVVVAMKEFKKATKPKEKLSEFFAESPLKGSGINLERVRDFPREVKL